MTLTKLKIAYAFFFASFMIWLSLFFYVCFPSGVWSTPIRFPDSSLFISFFGSAFVAVVSCLLIGLNHIGLFPKLKSKSKESPKTLGLNTTMVSQISSDLRTKEKEPKVHTAEEENPGAIVLPQLEEEQEVAN